MTLVRAPTRCVRIGVADQVKKILGTGARGVQNFTDPPELRPSYAYERERGESGMCGCRRLLAEKRPRA
jgi:hypothetical protein